MKELYTSTTSDGKFIIKSVLFDDMVGHVTTGIRRPALLACLLGMQDGVRLLKFSVTGKEDEEGKKESYGFSVEENPSALHMLFGDPACMDQFLKMTDAAVWDFDFIFNNVKSHALGETSGDPVIAFFCPVGEQDNINFLKLCYDITNCTFDYSSYNKRLVNLLKERFSFTSKRAVQQLDKFSGEKDIASEFFAGVGSDPFLFPKENAVTVEGYTAEKLFKNFPLNELGAYNYLIYLRHEPKEALGNLAKGLPRR